MAGTVILACPTLGVELKEAMKEENSRAVVYFMPPGLHRDPKALHHYVQNAVDHFYNVDRIVVCTTGCGGGNIGIKATTAPLIYPKTRDCLDILLSGDSLKDLKRDMMGVFLTEGWMEFMKESDIDFDKLKQKMGETKARMYLMKLYSVILVRLVEGELHIVPGHYGILRKMAREQFDDDFFTVPVGETVKSDSFPSNF